MKPIRVDSKDVIRAVESEEKMIQVGNRYFLLIEVEETDDSNVYEVTDPEEEKQLLEALNLDNPIVTEDELIKLLETSYPC